MNINIESIVNVKEKPTRCIRCGNTELNDNVVKTDTGNPSHDVPVSNVENAHCAKCSTLMVVYSQ